MHKHLPHIHRNWNSIPIYFITTCTHQRKPILVNNQIVQILIDEWRGAIELHGWLVGRYIIMPDHVHFFCTLIGDNSKDISGFMQQWKQWTSKRIIRECNYNFIELKPPIWQKEFFDHILRSEESYRQKWEYVIENPVRKNLVMKSEDWPWQGEIFDLTI